MSADGHRMTVVPPGRAERRQDPASAFPAGGHMTRQSPWMVLVGAILLIAAMGATSAPATADANPYGDPSLVSMFDGTTLNGWTPHKASGWNVKDDAIHGTGTAGRGWIYY